MSKKYYYLIAGLPELLLEKKEYKIDFNLLFNEIISNLDTADYNYFKYIIYLNDNKNLVTAIG